MKNTIMDIILACIIAGGLLVGLLKWFDILVQ